MADEPLPLPRLLDARLEPACDPEANLGRAASSPLKSWAVQRAPADAGAREVEEALWRDRGDVDLLYVPLQTLRARLKRELFGRGRA